MNLVEGIFVPNNKICYTGEGFLFDKSLILHIQSEIDKTFITSGLCQYIDQVNSLSELSHKLRLTYMGEGGLSSNTAEMSIRDVQRWHYGRICPIDSPEGQNIGLVSVLASYSNIDVNGNILTAYCKVYKGMVSNNIIYLNYSNEDKYVTAFSLKNLSTNKRLFCLKKGKPYISNIRNLDLCVLSNYQFFSHAVNLIPFLSHNDATRVLMAANMQKQAVPLLIPQYPLIGEESSDMKNIHDNILAKYYGIVVNVDSNRVVVFEIIKNRYRVYLLPKSKGNNQNMCSRFIPVVDTLQIVNSGDTIAECQSSSNGEISLGVNLLVAFMCWNGFNYEDSVLISSDVVSRGDFLSFHIIELEIKVIKSKYGDDVLTNEINSIPIEKREHLSKDGIVRIGCVVKEGDVLVGKLSFLPNNENKFGNLETIDSSLKVPEGIDFASVLEILRLNIKYQNKPSLKEYIFACNCLKKTYIRKVISFNQIYNIKDSMNSGVNLLNKSYLLGLKEVIKHHFLNKDRLIVNSVLSSEGSEGSEGSEVILDVIKVKLLVRKSIRSGDKICGRHGNKGVISRIVPKEDMPFMADGTPVDIVFNPLSIPSRMNLGQILEVNFGLISYKFGLEFKHLLEMYKNKDKKLVKIAFNKLLEIYPKIKFYDESSLLELIRELSKGVKLCCPSFIKIKNKRIENFYKRVGLENSNGQIQLFDGRTGLPFERKATVGIIYVFKLNHLVDEKMHARSIGPYSGVTQQPLKGKSKGGQKMGEMEVWALQSYGATYMIKEILSAKCSDIIARRIMYTSIINNNPILISTWSEGLLVLIKELCSLCIKVKFK